MKSQLNTCIRSLYQEESFVLELRHNSIGDQLMDNEEPIVWNEPILDRYWDVLEAEIDRRKQLDIVTEDICSIQIENVETKKERLDALVAIFRSGRATNSSTTVEFINTNLCGEGIISLSKLVDVSLQLNTLTFIYNRIDSMELARCLSRSLKSHTCINRLWLNHCDLGRSPKYSWLYYSQTLIISS